MPANAVEAKEQHHNNTAPALQFAGMPLPEAGAASQNKTC
jgi:hypothetical protein